ncbi:hypothetical protein [Actinoplanes couchii]|uniref:hypothetical protein n=1 Tax=Actinoplanes couchii TaxID=403638 RepID=UPI002866CC58|nr:hypothetical protein [Actinoplanes couchii]MDR6321588.1 hypothetical protein [Actinoplanes couchii]
MNGDHRGQLAGSGGDPAEVEGGFGQADRGAAQCGGGGGRDPALAGGQAVQGGAGLDGAGQVGAGGGDGQLGDRRHLVAAGAADPGQPRLAARTEHPLAGARITFPQVVVEFADADPAVAVAVGGAAGDAVGDQAGERGRFRPGRRGDHHPALPLGGAGRPEVVAGVDRAAGAAVEDHHGLAGPAALHQGRGLCHVERGVRGTAHHGVGGGQVEPAAGPGQHHAAEVEQDTIVLVAVLEQGFDPAPRLRCAGIAQELHLEPAERLLAEHLRERGDIGRRHREPAQHGVVVLLDANDDCQSSCAHRMHHPSSMVRRLSRP